MFPPNGWTLCDAGTATGAVPVLTRRLAGRDVALPSRPGLGRDAEGRPRLSLTLILSQRPTGETASIEPLITSGVLAFTASLALPAGESLPSLFARRANFWLRRGAVALQDVEASGPEASGAFSVLLDRTGALDVLRALGGEASGLELGCRVEYRDSEPSRQIRFVGTLGAIHAVISEAGPDPIDRPALARCVAALLHRGSLRVDVNPGPASSAEIVDAFVRCAAPLLRPVTAPDGTRWRLAHSGGSLLPVRCRDPPRRPRARGELGARDDP
jgi:hypothetical protein